MAFLIGRYFTIATGVGGVCGLATTGFFIKKGMMEDYRSTPKTVDDCLKQASMDVGNIALAGAAGAFVGAVAGILWPVTICSLGVNLYSCSSFHQAQQEAQQDAQKKE